MGFLNQPKKAFVGRANAELIRAAVRAKKAEDWNEFNRLETLIKASQADCPHPEAERRTARNTNPKPQKRYKKGDLLTWCFRCGKILLHNGKDVGEELPLTAWERLLDDDFEELCPTSSQS